MAIPVLLGSLVAGGAGYGYAHALAGQKSQAGPRMEIEPEEHDFGNVQQDQTLVHDFLVQNTGTEELVIEKISTSCGCTAAIPSDRVVPPGGSTTLRVTVETRKYKGILHNSISLASNDARRVRTVRVQAFVEADW